MGDNLHPWATRRGGERATWFDLDMTCHSNPHIGQQTTRDPYPRNLSLLLLRSVTVLLVKNIIFVRATARRLVLPCTNETARYSTICWISALHESAAWQQCLQHQSVLCCASDLNVTRRPIPEGPSNGQEVERNVKKS